MTRFGRIEGLSARLAEFHRRLRTDRSWPWQGTGILADLEIVMTLLDLREFADWLRAHGPEEHRGFADEIAENEETLRATEVAIRDAGDLLEIDPDPPAAIEKLAAELKSQMFDREILAAQLDAIRNVLVERGALDEEDNETSLPLLVEVLLS